MGTKPDRHASGVADKTVTAPTGSAIKHAEPDLDAMMEQIREEVQRCGPLAKAAEQETKERARAARPPTGPSTAEILERIRAELARRRSQSAAADEAAPSAFPSATPRWHPAEPRLESKSEYKLAELLRFDDADFINTAYQTLLRRPPDPAGRDDYLGALRNGRVGKIEVLGAIRFSEEGRSCGVHVDGLLLPYKLHQWRRRRLVGPVLGFAMGMFRLPRLALRLQSMEAKAARESHELGLLLNGFDREVGALRAEVTQSILARVDVLRVLGIRIETMEDAAKSQAESLRRRAEEVDERHRDLVGSLAGLDRAASKLDGEIMASRESQEMLRRESTDRFEALDQMTARLEHGLQSSRAEQDERHRAVTDRLADLGRGLSDRDRAWRDAHASYNERLQQDVNRLTSHEAAIARLNDQAAADQHRLHLMFERLSEFIGNVTKPDQDVNGIVGIPSDLASQYASFEDDFRGDREQIKQRALHYLGTLDNASIRPGDGLVLDLGSGRGEWLEVLIEHGYACRGVDLNAGMLEESRQRGHDVVEADAIEHLRTLEDGSVAAITSMHMVEHLPHPVLINLLDEAFRVLRPGGVLILETPNPENVLVGSCMFYMDPTHLHPIPPPLLQWLVKSRGFDGPVVERLSEYRAKPDLEPVSEQVPGAEQINQMIAWFTAPPDFAVVARKTAATRDSAT